MAFKLIPGQFYKGFYEDSFCVWGDECESAAWQWPTCLGVALSIAGALTAAYSRGNDDGFAAGLENGYVNCYDHFAAAGLAERR